MYLFLKQVPLHSNPDSRYFHHDMFWLTSSLSGLQTNLRKNLDGTAGFESLQRTT